MRNRIPLFNLKSQYKNLMPEVRAAVNKVFSDTAFAGGPYVASFEKKFASYCNTKYAIGVNSGTSALYLALYILGIGPGDEVIVPANTFIASAWAVSYTGATPVFVDCRGDTFNIDANQIEKKIKKNTKAIIGVHLYGQPFDIDPVIKIAKKNNLYLIEDAAQAHGARYKGKRVGGAGEMGAFSFYPGKNLGAAGEGGMITTNNKKYSDRLQILKNQGAREKYYFDQIGFNMRMEGLQGAILEVKLKYLEKWNKRRRQIAKIYQKNIQNEKIKIQFQPEWAQSVYHLFVITTKNRDKLRKYLLDRGVGSGIYYPLPCHLQKAYQSLGYKKGDFPEAEYLANHNLAIPIYPELNDRQVRIIVDLMNKY